MAYTPRTLQQIKAQWGILKMNATKKKCLERKQRLQTCSGPPSATDIPNSDDIAVWLPHELTVDTNEFDSDRMTLELLIDKKIEKPTISFNLPLLCENPEPEIEMINKGSASATLQIADVNIICGKELDEAQMANEKQKLNKISLKEEVLKNKLS